jgi:2-amino-4-hydroxy-6-hydroxymethyldihydropteridine diphosphokinase
MARAYISLGSNIDPEYHLQSAIHGMAARFGTLALSTVYRSQAMGFEGPDFLNLVARIDTDLSVQQVCAILDAIERDNGRERDGARFASRTLDLDLLLYDNLVCDDDERVLPRPEIEQYAFVLRPLADLAPNLVHPVTGLRIADMWARFTRDQKLEPVPMQFAT